MSNGRNGKFETVSERKRPETISGCAVSDANCFPKKGRCSVETELKIKTLKSAESRTMHRKEFGWLFTAKLFSRILCIGRDTAELKIGGLEWVL